MEILNYSRHDGIYFKEINGYLVIISGEIDVWFNYRTKRKRLTMFNERNLLKIQKQRHLSDIRIMLLNNTLFKNLSERDQKKMMRLIYKAEMIEMHARDRRLVHVNESFQDIITAIINSDFNDEDDDKDPFREDER